MTVIDELDKCFEAKVQELAHFLESEKGQREAKAAHAAEDAAARDAAELQQQDCSNRLLEAKQAQKEAAAALKEAEAAVENFEPTLKAATAVRDANQQELQIFLDGAVACFHQLKAHGIQLPTFLHSCGERETPWIPWWWGNLEVHAFTACYKCARQYPVNGQGHHRRDHGPRDGVQLV
ncbi:unnamed protein product [Symbiodinium microadriaticum]|nr:unnamed protein product [Symbiodinium microadriaticum]CAE7640660.1 unnamed protein product [Symbiodinium sp. KB8]